MCATAPSSLARSSPCRPVMSASAMMSAITPTATPIVENSETSETRAWRRGASR